MAAFEDRVLYQGDPWVRLDTLPRLLAEGWRRTLTEGGVVSVVRTPFQWSMGSPVIEIETGGYMGDVGLYVPEVQLPEALVLLGLEDDADAEGGNGAEEQSPPGGQAR
ncbi:hypothetical protein LAJ19_12545 [Deinococcus taeanensis]|uniref:hypothetical protein n=1 Tax=Deinococcus taeanensis TaxID=2737050 RepID=UPI001CDD7FDA|nr:hypothetical protein [Deinococcus taeanensis]UBV42440.1 hypothetical protein LAJ19_12545 [Deinococcus taeanensis]